MSRLALLVGSLSLGACAASDPCGSFDLRMTSPETVLDLQAGRVVPVADAFEFSMTRLDSAADRSFEIKVRCDADPPLETRTDGVGSASDLINLQYSAEVDHHEFGFTCARTPQEIYLLSQDGDWLCRGGSGEEGVLWLAVSDVQ